MHFECLGLNVKRSIKKTNLSSDLNLNCNQKWRQRYRIDWDNAKASQGAMRPGIGMTGLWLDKVEKVIARREGNWSRSRVLFSGLIFAVTGGRQGGREQGLGVAAVDC